MAWSLEIHHLDIKHVGDATIVVARCNDPKTVRTVLIDGGLTSAGNIIHNYLKNTLKVTTLDVIAITHYDRDHFTGVTAMLGLTEAKMSTDDDDPNKMSSDDDGPTYDKMYDKTIIYDPGFPLPKKDGNYNKFDKAISKRTKIKRPTTFVNSFSIVNYIEKTVDNKPVDVVVIPRGVVTLENSKKEKTNYGEPHWLINKEIMWGNGEAGQSFASKQPNGAPRILCVAANKYVLQKGDTLKFVSGETIRNIHARFSDSTIAANENKNRNAKSMAFLIEFNNFRYYVGGDLETLQEESLMEYLNPNDNMTGRVLAMKTSHHGSNGSSSRKFINRLRPSAAFISTGNNNTHKHPGQFAVNVLDGYDSQPVLADADNYDRHPPTPPPPPFRPVLYYLTGFQSDQPLQTFGGDSSQTAGVPASQKPGHIVLSVSENQSKRPVEGQIYRGIQAVLKILLKLFNINDAQDKAANSIAGAGASSSTAEAVALVVGVAPDKVKKIVNNTLYAVARLGDKIKFNKQTKKEYRTGVMTVALEAIKNKKNNESAPDVVFKAVTNIGEEFKVTNAQALALAVALTSKTNPQAIFNTLKNAKASDDEAKAATFAAAAAYAASGGGDDDPGYAAVAAIEAVAQGATMAQAVAIAVAVTATLAVLSSSETARITTDAAMKAGLKEFAVIAGAVAGASYYEGVPSDVGEAVKAALKASGLNVDINSVSALAKAAATLDSNDLFNVGYASVNDNNENKVHNF